MIEELTESAALGEKIDLNKVAFRGDVLHCIKYNKCKEGWQKDTFSPEQLEWYKQFENAKSASFTIDRKGNLKNYHVEQ